MLEVNRLDPSPRNARRTVARAATEDLKASIESHGLMHNLVVTEAGKGRYRVIAGGRRLAALRALQREGKLPADHAVPCRIAGDEHALELSLAENTVRLAMHPADEFEAFARLIDGGASVELVAERFGVTSRHVEQRLRLGKLSPKLLKVYRDGGLTLDCLMAFAITDDRKKQWEVYRSLEPWQRPDAAQIRAALTGEMAEANSKLAVFVGPDAYHDAGGTSRGDLFGERVYLEDAQLLHRLAIAKLEAARLQLETEGWKWAEASIDCDWSVIHRCGRIYPQPVGVPAELLALKSQAEAELSEIEQALEETGSDTPTDALDAAGSKLFGIEERIASHVAYDPQEMRAAGCYVSIRFDGTLAVERGLVRREDRRLLAAGDERPTKAAGTPGALTRHLEACRLEASQLAVARHRLIALDLLAFTVTRSVFDRGCSHPLDLQLRMHRPGVEEPTRAAEELETVKAGLPLGWLKPRTEAEQFQAFIGLAEGDKLDLLAYGVALGLKPQLATGNEASACELALSLTDARMETYWRPTTANYLGRITREQLLALGREIFGDPWAHSRAKDKKAELAEQLERAFADPTSYGRTPEQAEKLKKWLPAGMQLGGSEQEPKPAGARKSRKAA
ncbi:ParB N-terminal domain-containing protein [Singulisphaera sp. PoT]|uniref:ParB/RepB/Spo0J family partition protein n=1 Tax=Singulisphaera sp. PoT TaxID=3411797 RepID=UPI003BF54AF7